MREPKTKVICLKVSPGELKAIDALVRNGNFKSASDVLRSGLNAIMIRFCSTHQYIDEIEKERRIRPPRRSTLRKRLDFRKLMFKDDQETD